MDSLLVYVTCKNGEEAGIIAKALLEKRLVACANIFPPHRTLYRWREKIEDGTECAVIFKTRSGAFDSVRDEICALHSYECPCIVALPVTDGHAPFLRWIGEETTGA